MMYVLWKRSDGHVGVSCKDVPKTLIGGNGTINTFTELLRSENWQEIVDRYKQEAKEK